MRTEAMQYTAPSIARIHGYHNGMWGTETYAQSGFRVNKYFTSDRFELLEEDGDGNWYRKSGEPFKGIGIEKETQCDTITEESVLAEVFDKIIFKAFKDPDMWKMQEDGSLGGHTSVECITQVMTIGRLRNEYANFRKMYHYFKAFGIETESSETNCGMHVNISRALLGDTEAQQDENVRKLFYIINRHYDTCRQLFHRTGSTEWCGQMYYGNIRTADLSEVPNDHRKCVNLSHWYAGGAARVEIRLVGGQKNYACFRNTMESVIHLVNRVRTLKWNELDDLVKIFKGCNQHVYDRLTVCGLSYDTLRKIETTVKTVEWQ